MEVEFSHALPSPNHTPYRTPSSSRSRQTSRGGFDDMSPATTPPPLPSSEERTASRVSKRVSSDSTRHSNGNMDETLPLTDPRRFTPTLHASLVSEILSLRREVENKTKNIDHLEQSLHSVQSQNESLNTNLVAANKEVRQIKRQMQILEGGTLSAINELAKERDHALSEVTEMRSRLDQAQKKAKAHEATADHTQELWQKDKESWATEKRTLETKVHVVEGRLKVVLSEISKTQLLSQEENDGTPHRSQSRASVLESPVKTGRDRRQSTNSVSSDHAGGRTSVLSMGHGIAVNLAEELNALNDIEEDSASEGGDHNGRISPDALPEEHPRPTSRLSIKAKKILGLPIDLDDVEPPNNRASTDLLANANGIGMPRESIGPKYVDTGIQYSRPSTPVKRWRPSTTDSMFNYIRSPDETPRNSKAFSVTSPTSATFSDDTADANWEATLRNQPIMVSSSCQTIEQMPSPPLTPKEDTMLATIHESIETREFGVQTEPIAESQPPSLVLPQAEDTPQQTNTKALDIPTIAIIPPSSRPMTPAEHHVQLPPRTKNVGCQVEIEVLSKYTNSTMQTEQIHVDKRNLIPCPTVPPPPPPTTAQPQSIFAKSKPVGYVRRSAQNTANSSMRRTIPNQSSTLPPIEDGSPDEGSGADEVPPMPQFNQGITYDDMLEELGDLEEDDVFHEDEFLSRPTAKFTLQRGKMISQEKSREDITDNEAALIGERLALENIRLSEDGLPPFVVPSSERARAQVRSNNNNNKQQMKRVPSARSNNIRRTALITSGTVAHQSKNSQSSMGSSETSARPPPMPIPVRYSSARVGKAISEGGRNSRGSSTASPTKNPRRITKPHLRKTRSGPALSPAAQAARRERSRSPPLPERQVSILPEMPGFQMPTIYKNSNMALSFNSGASYEASAPRPSIATGPSRQAKHVKQTSDALSMQQTSVVDAIAQTMVGEWMYKYVRRRKSFGKPDKDWDPNKSVDELANNTVTGVRHKRWVWLAPYERSVMWSSKQPTDGTSLMGKSGRKLTIKSVLDVRDDNPMPKGSIKGPHFNRSILILTPQRALKFTATTQERHFIWLTALSFLSHSPISLNDLAPMPPLPPDDQTIRSSSPAASLGGSFRRRPIRDSIRIAKGSMKGGPTYRSFTAENLPTIEYDQNGPGTHEYYDPNQEAAMPPTIRRYHSRNRSNTAPRPPRSSLRTLMGKDSGNFAPASAYSNSGGPSDRGSFDRPAITPSEGTPTFPISRRGSEASALGRPMLNGVQHFEPTLNSSHAASMTMRMEAFIERQTAKIPLRSMKSGPQLPQVSRGGSSFQQFRKDLAYWGADDGSRPSMSPVESMMPDSIRQSGSSMGRASSDREYFR